VTQDKKAIVEVIARSLEIDPLEVTDESLLTDLRKWDSFRHIELIVACEALAQRQLSSDEVESLRTVADFIMAFAGS